MKDLIRLIGTPCSGAGLSGLVSPRGCEAGNQSSNPADRVSGKVWDGPVRI
jgi:hypothetical protein